MRTKPEVLLALERNMNTFTGQEGVFEDIVRQNDLTVDQTLAGLGLTRSDSPDVVRAALIQRLGNFDTHLVKLLGPSDMREAVLQVFTPPRGMFLKHDRVAHLLERYPPDTLLEHFGYANVAELVQKEGFAPVMSALRFTQSEEWMHHFFHVGYRDLTPDDFEERDVELIMLDPKWRTIAEQFVAKKYHNISHLKELGIIFVIPVEHLVPGDTLRQFTLLLHYLHEVPFYANLFRQRMGSPNFASDIASLLRGDVPPGPLPDSGKISWRVVQRYLAKDNAMDFRLFEPHVSPEADHWWHAEEDLARTSRTLGHDTGTLDLGWWTGLDFVGEVFSNGTDELVSFDLIDILMSLTLPASPAGGPEQRVFLYHQQEALWNKIFIEYMGLDRMEELMQQHIIDGFITLT